MNNKSCFIRYILLIPILIAVVGCSAGAANVNSATRTVQAERAQKLATSMAVKVLATLTADARTTLSDEPTQVIADNQSFEEAQLVTRTAAAREATSAAQSTQNVLQTEARQVLIDEAQQWPVLLSDSFEQNANGWPVGSETDPLADITWKYSEGRYRWEAIAKDGFVWWAIPDQIEYSDYFYITAEMKQLSGPEDAECGIVFHQSGGSNFYLFEINGQGQFSLYLNRMDEWEQLLPWIGISLNQGEAIRLGVIALGPKILLLINDEFLAEVNDHRLGSGNTGLLVGLSNPGDEATWEFDNFELRAQNTVLTQEGTVSPAPFSTPALEPTATRLPTATTTPLPPTTARRGFYTQNH